MTQDMPDVDVNLQRTQAKSGECLSYMRSTFLNETVLDCTTNALKTMSGVQDDLTPTPAAQFNLGTLNGTNFNPDLSTATNIRQYLRAFYTRPITSSVAAKGNVYLGKVLYFCTAKTYLTTNSTTTVGNNALYNPLASGTASTWV